MVLSFQYLSLLFAMQPEGMVHESGGGIILAGIFKALILKGAVGKLSTTSSPFEHSLLLVLQT